MDDLQRYIEQRKDLDLEFAKTFDAGYQQFKIDELLRYARERVEFPLKPYITPLMSRNFSPSPLSTPLKNKAVVPLTLVPDQVIEIIFLNPFKSLFTDITFQLIKHPNQPALNHGQCKKRHHTMAIPTL